METETETSAGNLEKVSSMRSSFTMRVFPQNHFKAAFTLTEVTMTIAMASVILGAIMVASLTLQKSLQASQDYTNGMAAQLRVMDYIGLDLRRAMTVTAPAGHIFDVQIPDYYDSSSKPRQPNLPPTNSFSFQNNSYPLYYGTGTIPVSYSQVGTNIVRNYNGTSMVVVSNVKNVLVQAQKINDPKVTVTISFLPTFHHGTALDAAAQQATTMTETILMRNSVNVSL